MTLDPDQIAVQIGRRIAELRQQRGWSQTQLAEAIRGSFQWVSQIEAGQNLTIHSLVKVANAFGVTLQDLLEAPDPAVPRGGRGRPRKNEVR